jgi:hypothetical protein
MVKPIVSPKTAKERPKSVKSRWNVVQKPRRPARDGKKH